MTTHNYGTIVQVNCNPAGGVPKYPVAEAELTIEGVRGDHQRDREYHGGPRRAVSIFALERIRALQAEGHPISPGSTGENLTIAGLDWANLALGDRLLIGESVEIEITSYATPCGTIAESFVDGRFVRLSQKLHPGWSRLYAQVVYAGVVRPGDRIIHHPRATV